jgi:hypothetical protein
MYNNFFEDKDSKFKVSFDRVAFNCFWHEFSLQEFLYSKFESNGVQEIKFFKFNNFGPAIHESYADTFGNFWISKIGDLIVSPIDIFKKFSVLHKIIDIAKNFSHFLQSKFTSLRFQLTIFSDPILFSCTIEEFFYYRDNILEVKESMISHEVILFITNINIIEAFKVQKKYGIKCFSFLPYFFKNMFSSELKQQSLHSFEGPFFALKSDKVCFDYFQNIRWPALIAHEKRLYDLIKKIDPSVIIYTSLEDYFNQMIGRVASDSNIDSISLSHGVLGSTRRGVSFANHFIVASKFAQFCAIASGIAKSRISILQNLNPTHEYPMDYLLPIESSKFNILVLLDPIKASSDTRVFASPLIGYQDQVNALRDLKTLIMDDRINLIIKTHPGWPEQEIIGLADEQLIPFVCPSTTSLENLLDTVDLVIGLNYHGAALIAAAQKELPIILHYVAPYEIFSKFENTYSRFLDLKLGKYTKNSIELHLACVSALEDTTFMNNLIQSSIQFSKNYLLPDNQLTLNDFVASKLKESK